MLYFRHPIISLVEQLRSLITRYNYDLDRQPVVRDLEDVEADSPHFQFFMGKLRLLTHVVDHLSHNGIDQCALPAYGGKDAVGGNKSENKGVQYSPHSNEEAEESDHAIT